MLRLSSPRFVFRRVFYGNKASSSLPYLVKKPEEPSLEDYTGQNSSDTKASQFNFNSVLLF